MNIIVKLSTGSLEVGYFVCVVFKNVSEWRRRDSTLPKMRLKVEGKKVRIATR